MTKIVFTKDDKTKTLTLTAEGHAEYDEYGRDIICSAVSILVYSYASVAEGLRKEGDISRISEMTVEKGKTRIQIKAKNYNSYAETIKYFFGILTGFDLLAKSYPEHVSFVMTETRR